MNDCVFCKIINNVFSSYKVYEDKDILAFLDINPNTKGVTLIVPKKHVGSSINDIDDNTYLQTMKAAKKISEHYIKVLNIEKVGIAIEGTGVNHFHVKLYPFYFDNALTREQQKEKFESQKRIFNKYYQGYLTTQLGFEADKEELKNLSEKLFLK